jgi:hypothetical protein
MKKLIIAAAALIVSLSAYGQGQFVFNNRVPPDIDAKIRLATDTGTSSSLAGNAYLVQILGGPQGGTLAPLGTTDFRSGAAAGYVNPLTVTVPGVPDKGIASIMLNVFQGTSATGTPIGSFGPFQVTVAEAPNLPSNLALGTSPLIVPIPEPTTLALGALGLGALLMIRRRK